jgi:chromosome segregation and condensation protein ScpB
VFRYLKRETDDAGCLIANEEDLENARELYIELGGHDRDKYSEPELKVLNAILIKGGETTQAEIQELSGLSAGRVSDILNGRGRDGHGLLYKCKDLTVSDGERPKKYKLSRGFNPTCKVSIELAEPT